MSVGHVYRADGRLVASVTQENLIRRSAPFGPQLQRSVAAAAVGQSS
jgi:hypothetical protein